MAALKHDLNELAIRINRCLVRDRRRLLSQAEAVQRADKNQAEALARVEEAIRASEAKVSARRALVPAIRYPDDLPISQRRAEIAAAIEQHQVVVICGETGSGKTTQLPKICLELGRGIRGMIGHTQPRRIAARSVADRVAHELGVRHGEVVGSKVRFGDRTSDATLVKLMTDGILLAETQGDRAFEQYDTIIVDEAHERSLNIDFLLGYLRTLLPRRPDLKVIITSATIDPDRFARHFASPKGPAPVILVSGRTYPVEVRYRPLVDEDARDGDIESGLLAAVDELAREGSGDILAFFSGEREIRDAAEFLRKHHTPGDTRTSVLPLYAKLSASEQQRVFEPHPGRRIVLATNVAETSLTVPGIRYVIDTGVARVSRYSARTKVQRLEIEAISKASAQQRTGRCGRLGPGICIRLYAQDDFSARSEFTDPEILRTSLASVILQMKSLRLGRIEEFPFIEPPEPRLIRDGYETLRELGAVDEGDELTPLGRDLARLPIDVRVGRMILAGVQRGCLAEMLVIASFLSVQDPRERPIDAQQAADEQHARFRNPESDYLGILSLWAFYRDQKRHLSHSKLRALCRASFLSYVRLREWENVHHQLAELGGSMGWHANREPALPDEIHRSLLTGLLSNIGRKRETGEFQGPRGLSFRVFPGSALFKKTPAWVMAGELVRTTQLWARQVAGVKTEWIEAAAGHLLKRSWFDPHWSRESGKAFAFERLSLHGLDIVERRRTPLGPLDAAKARELFIHHALVEGDAAINAPAIRQNLALAEEMRALEVRARRLDLLAESAARFAFYDRVLPPDVWSVSLFEAWRVQRERGNPKILQMSMGDLVAPGVTPPTRAAFPDAIRAGDVTLPLRYVFDAAKEDDGVTLVLPVEAMAHVEPARLAWLIPGLLREKVELIIKSLPKSVRRLIAGPSTLAARFVEETPFGEGDLFERLSRFLTKATSVEVLARDLAASPLPAYLQFRVEVHDTGGKVLASGRDFGAIRDQLSGALRSAVLKSGDSKFTRDDIRDWDFGTLPERVELKRAGVVVPAFPAILDKGASVSLRLVDSAAAAQWHTRRGVRRLFTLTAGREFQRQTMHLPGVDRLGLQFASLGGTRAISGQIRDLVADRAFIGNDALPRSRDDFDIALTLGMQRVGRALEEVKALCGPIGTNYHAARLGVDAQTPPTWAGVIVDMREQLAHLCPPTFLVDTPLDRLAHYPRYLAGIVARLRKLPGGNLAKDAQNAAQIEPWWRVFVARHAQDPEAVVREPEFAAFRWLIEEMRISLFAQELRTAVPVSLKRLQEQWQAVVKARS